MNKADLLQDPFALKRLEIAYPGAMLVSSLIAGDMLMLKKRIGSIVNDFHRQKTINGIIERQDRAAAEAKESSDEFPNQEDNDIVHDEGGGE
jgi:hypothetical protein